MPQSRTKPALPEPVTPPGRTLLVAGLLVLLCVVLGIIGAAGAPPAGLGRGVYAMALLPQVLGWYVAAIPIPAILITAGACLGHCVRVSLARRACALPPGVAPALGLGAMLAIIHAIWWLAGFVGGMHAWIATAISWLTVAVPIALAIRLNARARTQRAQVNNAPAPAVGFALVPTALAIAVAIAFVLPYAVVPPGTLWPSEYGGYDALSYHLPLAQEWYAKGAIAPVAHNVYSYLPSYVESAFVHLAALAGAPQHGVPGTVAAHAVNVGLLAGDGRLVLSTQILHVLMLAIAAWAVSGLVHTLATRLDASRFHAMVGATIAAVLTVATPWMVVVSTLAYNEAPLVALIGAALACAVSADLGPRSRGVLCGVLVGLACGVKPTALVLSAPMVGIAMLYACWQWGRGAPGSRSPVSSIRSAAICVTSCLVAGAVMLAPWMIRNAIQSGNPVFPFATGLFGTAHWTMDQAARYAHAHKPDRGVFDALQLLVLPDPTIAPDAPSVQRFRGLTNPQWLPLMALGALSLGVLTLRSKARSIALVFLAGVVVTCVAWAATTHAQSRFLMPLVPVASACVGLAIAFSARGAASLRVRLASPNALAVVAAFAAIITHACVRLVLAHQAGGALFTAFAGPRVYTAGGQADAFAEALQRGDQSAASNLVADADPARTIPLLPSVDLSRVLLIGNAAPFYFGPVAYRTTWDTWPILPHIAASPTQPGSWTSGLHADGFDFALVDLAEVSRLSRSGYLDPRITPDALTNWMRSSTRLVRAWQDRGVFLVDLRPSSAP